MFINRINVVKGQYRANKNHAGFNLKENDLSKNENTVNDLPGGKFYSGLSFLGNRPEVSRSEVLNTIRNSEPISRAGLKGDVYKLQKGEKAYAIKIAKIETDFSKEAEILKRVPKGLGQEFTDYFKDPATGFDILVSTFAEGKKGTLQTKEDFKTFFDNLLFLDRAEILHGDLNMENCLFFGDKINLIDFGEGSIISTGDGYEEMYPPFMLKTNAVNLEQNGIPDCIKSWVQTGIDTKETFKTYLNAKGEFYKSHAEYLAKSGISNKDAINFETNLARVLSAPSERVVKNELRRMDALYTFEQADTAVNYAKSPKSAIRNWHLTIQKTEKMLSEIEENLALADLSKEERTYFEYQKTIAQTMLSDYKDWSTGTIGWIESSFEKPDNELSEHEKAFRQNRDTIMEMPPDLLSMVIGG